MLLFTNLFHPRQLNFSHQIFSGVIHSCRHRIMSNLSFTIDWGALDKGEDTKDHTPEPRRAISDQGHVDHTTEPRRSVSDGNAGSTSWEIDMSSFSSGNGSGQAKTKRQFIPKFLRDTKQNTLQADITKKSKPNLGTKPAGHYKSPISPPKAKGPKSLVISPSTDSSPSPSKTQRGIATKKQPPAIRKSLLPMTSPVRKPIWSPEVNTHSESLCVHPVSNKDLNRIHNDAMPKKKTRQNISTFLGATKKKVELGEEQRDVGGDESNEVW